MSKAWKIIGALVLALAIAGVVCAGIGLITGASADRMVELIFGGWDAFETLVNTLLQEIKGLWAVTFVTY